MNVEVEPIDVLRQVWRQGGRRVELRPRGSHDCGHLIALDCKRVGYYQEIVDYERDGSAFLDLFEWNPRSIPR